MNTNLVFDNGVIEVVYKITHMDHVSFVLRVFGGSGSFG